MTARREESIDLATGLVRLSQLVQGVFARVSERHDLTPTQARLLCILAEQPRRMAELAGLLGVEKAALTGLVDRAGRRGLVERTPVPGDRRAWRVRLTKAGQRSAVAVHNEICTELGELTVDLALTECERFRRSLARIIRAHAITASPSADEEPIRVKTLGPDGRALPPAVSRPEALRGLPAPGS